MKSNMNHRHRTRTRILQIFIERHSLLVKRIFTLFPQIDRIDHHHRSGGFFFVFFFILDLNVHLNFLLSFRFLLYLPLFLSAFCLDLKSCNAMLFHKCQVFQGNAFCRNVIIFKRRYLLTTFSFLLLNKVKNLSFDDCLIFEAYKCCSHECWDRLHHENVRRVAHRKAAKVLDQLDVSFFII